MVNFKKMAVGLGVLLSSQLTLAQSVTLSFDFMATNLKGNFATASGGTVVPVATLKLDDLDAGAGVRATFRVNDDGLSQFSSGTGGIYISAFELNIPETSLVNGYDPDANGGLGNNWTNVSGVPLAGGVEWQEGGATNGWGVPDGANSFGQEYNWGNGTNFTGLMTQASGETVIDIFNATGQSNVSVAAILANAVFNENDPQQPDAYAWIKIRSTRGAPGNRGIADSGWWGSSPQNNGSATGRYNLDVLATSYQINAVPVPAALPLMASALGLFGLGRCRVA